MNKREWLKFIRFSTEAHHIREIFNGTYELITDPAIKNMFFARIDYLLHNQADPHTKRSLEHLREDIEDEVETGKMRLGFVKPVKRIRDPQPPISNANKIAKYKSRIESMRIEIMRLEEIIQGLERN